jgi:hypothetical protein
MIISISVVGTRMPLRRLLFLSGRFRQGRQAMQTATELRLQATQYLELANTTNEFYARTVLAELAHKLRRDARQAERRERDLAVYLQTSSR